jgi:hypothetical protein
VALVGRAGARGVAMLQRLAQPLGHSKSTRTSTTWPVGWGWERRRWRALDGRYGDVKRERRCVPVTS